MLGIYSITNTLTDTVYFGQATDINKRLKEHYYSLLNNIHKNVYFQRSFNEYGLEAFIFSPFRILENKENLTYWEAHAIKEAKEVGMKVFNIKDPEDPRVWTKESREKLSLSMKGNKHGLGHKPSKEAIRKMSEGNKGKHHRTGWHHSEETKKKLSRDQLGNQNWRCRKAARVKYE